MRISLPLVWWSVFLAMIVAAGVVLLQACGFPGSIGLSSRWNFCPRAPQALSAEAERENGLRAEHARLQLALANQERDCAARPLPDPPDLELPTEADASRTQQTAMRRPPPPPPPPPPPVPPPNVLPCNWSGDSGGQGVTRNRHFLGNKPGVVSVPYDMKNQPDTLHVGYRGRLLASTHVPVSGVGTLRFNWSPEAGDYTVEIVVIGLEQETVWSYTVSCPG